MVTLRGDKIGGVDQPQPNPTEPTPKTVNNRQEPRQYRPGFFCTWDFFTTRSEKGFFYYLPKPRHQEPGQEG